MFTEQRRPSASAMTVVALLAVLALSAAAASEPRGFDFRHLAAVRHVAEIDMAPDGRHVAYVIGVPRRPGVDDDGPEWRQLWVVGVDGGAARPFVHGEVSVSDARFTPDGAWITYLAKRGDDDHAALWAIPLAGGESRRLVALDVDIKAYRLAPDGRRAAIVAAEPESDEREKARERGYSQEVFEEDWRPRRVWVIDVGESLRNTPTTPAPSAASEEPEAPEPLAVDGAVFDVAWTPDGKSLVLAVAPRPLIDDQYMLRRIRVHDAANGKQLAALANPGKLGAFAVSPDGRQVAMITADDPNDPKEGRLQTGSIDGGALRDLLPDHTQGHVVAFAWRDARKIVFVADIGTEAHVGELNLDDGQVKLLFASGGDGAQRLPLATDVSLSSDGRVAAIVGESPLHPAEVYAWSAAETRPRRLTRGNPWLDEVALARQEVLRYEARDGLELEGVLIHPLDDGGRPAPLLLIVHGGPEAHIRNGWVTTYSRPGQVAAARGYAVFYPNYRGSTGRGVAFSKLGQGDAAGREFDDLIDAVDHLGTVGIADLERVGVTGGSYGGYATAWCATRFTERFRAGVMFVGISNKVSKGFTTEIPVEDEMVHTLFDPWTRWQFSLERSPLYYAEQARTALLIAGGTSDTRVHPSQSLQLYRALKLIGNTPVRYVRYPGEGHGNRRAAARDDYARRLMRWMDHFVVAGARELPPWDLAPEDD